MEPASNSSIKRLSIRRLRSRVCPAPEDRDPMPAQYTKALLVLSLTSNLMLKSKGQLKALEQKQQQYLSQMGGKYQKNERNLFSVIAPKSRRIAGLQELIGHCQLIIDQVSLLMKSMLRPNQIGNSSNKIKSSCVSSSISVNIIQRDQFPPQKGGQAEIKSIELIMHDAQAPQPEKLAKMTRLDSQAKHLPQFSQTCSPKSYTITPFIERKLRNDVRHFDKFSREMKEAYRLLQSKNTCKSGIYDYFQRFTISLSETECVLSFRFLQDQRRAYFRQQKIIYFIQELNNLCVAIYGPCLSFARLAPSLAYKMQEFDTFTAVMSRQILDFSPKMEQFDELVHLLSDKMDILVVVVRAITKGADLALLTRHNPKMTGYLLEKFSEFRYFSAYAGIEIEKTHKRVFNKAFNPDDCFDRMRKMYSKKCKPLQMNSTIL